MFKRFSHTMLYVNDLSRAVAWYQETLGFLPNFVIPGAYASLRHDGMKMRLDLHPTEAKSKDVGFGAITYFAVDDIDSAIAALKDKGAKVGEPKKEGNSPRFVTFWDSEGNALGLEEEWKR